MKYTVYNIELAHRLYVYEVGSSSGAGAQGLKAGDVITAIDGVQVNTILEVKEQVYKHVPGDKITLTVERAGKTIEIPITLSAAE
jgi:serine protease Do